MAKKTTRAQRVTDLACRLEEKAGELVGLRYRQREVILQIKDAEKEADRLRMEIAKELNPLRTAKVKDVKATDLKAS